MPMTTNCATARLRVIHTNVGLVKHIAPSFMHLPNAVQHLGFSKPALAFTASSGGALTSTQPSRRRMVAIPPIVLIAHDHPHRSKVPLSSIGHPTPPTELPQDIIPA